MCYSGAMRFSENFFKKLIFSTLKKPQDIKEDLIKVLLSIFNQKSLYYAFIYLKKQSGVRCEFVLYSHSIKKNMTNKPLNLGAHAFPCNLQTGQTYKDC